ncbi:hypothetical protein GCM10020227_31840 [Streptomyces flavovirens]
METDQYAPYPTPATSASTRTITRRRARRPFFLPGFFASEEPEGAVVLAGIAVLRGAGWSWECRSNHRRPAEATRTRYGDAPICAALVRTLEAVKKALKIR